MQQKFIGNSIHSAIKRAILNNSPSVDSQPNYGVEQKYRRTSAVAPALAWGHWTEVWSQFGVVGVNRDSHVTRLRMSFDITSLEKSSFDVEIRGGDNFVRTIGPSSARITVTGNVATSISVRFRSHSLPLAIATSVY